METKKYIPNVPIVDQLEWNCGDYDNSLLRLKRISVGENFVLSIQAGDGLYSYPRTKLNSPKDYSQFELAIFLKNDWFNPRDVLSAENFDWIDLFEAEESPVAGYVTVEVVEQIAKDLLKLDNKIFLA